MPFGTKLDPSGRFSIDFDDVYERAIRPAATEAAVEVIRADEERGGGIIHKPMYERLLLAEIAIADLTFANANVFYELGIRHAARPRSTILIHAAIAALPFDVAPIRSLNYKVTDDGQLTDEAAEALRAALAERLELAKTSDEEDSPLFQLLPGLGGISLPDESTETFRDRARAAADISQRIRDTSRERDKDARVAQLRAIEREIGDFAHASRELPVELLLAYRDASAWDDMVRCVEAMPKATRAVVTVSEQYALALNRRNADGDRDRAIDLLHGVIDEYGPSPETYGLLGRCWKDRWEEQRDPDDKAEALAAAIDAYDKGFAADPRDYYPGVNLVTLLRFRGTKDDLARLEELLPVVQFAVGRRGGLASNDYWDRATVLELAVIAGDELTARRAAAKLRLSQAPTWMLETTARNLRILAVPLGDAGEWVEDVAAKLAPE